MPLQTNLNCESKTIDTVVFDLSEVLLEGLLGMRGSLAQKLGVVSDEVDLKIPELQLLFEGRISEVDYWNALIFERKWKLDVSDLQALVRANFREIQGTRDIIVRLKAAGYRVGLFSVHANEWIQFCERKYKYEELFDSIVYSFEIAVCKPERLAFVALLKQLGVAASEVLFIDDSTENVSSAAEMGISVILYESTSSLESALKKKMMLS